MSALSKVFVVFIFILSIAFFGTTATLYKTRVDWRNAYNEHKKETEKSLDELRKVNSDLLGRIATFNSKLITNEAALNERTLKLNQALEDLKAQMQLATNHAANAAKSAQLATNTEELLKAEKAAYTALQDTLTKAKTELDNALEQKRIADAERDSMRLDLEKSQQELHSVKTELVKLSEDHDTAQLQLSAYIQRVGPLTGKPVNPVDALIKKVDEKEKLVLISAGKDQKVQLGDEFTVHRSGSFIGKVKVIKVFPDLCGAEIILLKDNAAIQEGDRATTQI